MDVEEEEKKKRILVTGGVGVQLLKEGFLASVIDNLDKSCEGAAERLMVRLGFEAGDAFPASCSPLDVYHTSIASHALKPGIFTWENPSRDGSLLVKAPARDAELHYSLVGCTCAPAFQFEDFLVTFSELISLAPKAEPFLKFLTNAG